MSTDPLTSAPALPSFQAVFQNHVAFVWRTLKRLGVREVDLEDICQEVFLIVHRKLAEFHGGSMHAWLYGICMRKASEYRRRPHRSREEALGDDVPDLCVPPAQHDETERRHMLDRLDRSLQKLDDDKRTVFVLYDIEGVPMAEIAASMGCPLQTAYSRLHAARRVIVAEILGDEEPRLGRAASAGGSRV